MIYTNRTLETIFNEKDNTRKVELSNIYGKEITLETTKDFNPKVFFIKQGFNRLLNIKQDRKNIKVANELTEDIYLILDLQDYKIFNNNSALLQDSSCEKFETVKTFKLQNRACNCNWGIHIIKAPKEEISVLKLVLTSGKENYITIVNGYVRTHLSSDLVDRYFKKAGIKKSLSDFKFDLLIK